MNVRHFRSKEFDTLGTWDTRLNVAIDEAAVLKTGQVNQNFQHFFHVLNLITQVVPSIEAGMVGVATHEGRRSYQEDRFAKYPLPGHEHEWPKRSKT